MDKRPHPPLPEDLTITKNYKGIALTAIVLEVYDALLLNRTKPKIEKIKKKKKRLKTVFGEINQQLHRF